MSISLLGVIAAVALAPAYLLTREVVGHEKFDQWLDSGYEKYKMDCSGAEEWRKLITDAGYDIVPFIGNYKTHLTKDYDTFFLWEITDGEFIASLYIDNEHLNNAFMNTVERKAGRKIFYRLGETIKAVESQNTNERIKPKSTIEKEKKKELEFVTIYNSHDLLRRTLDDYGVAYSADADTINAHFEGLDFKFSRANENMPYSLIVKSTVKEKDAASLLRQFDPEYTRIAQEQVYCEIKDRCEQADCKVIEETVLEDNSILLTITV